MVAAGRRKFFYVYHLASGRVERVARVQGMDEERSLETFAASPAQGSGPELAFLGNGTRSAHRSCLRPCDLAACRSPLMVMHMTGPGLPHRALAAH